MQRPGFRLAIAACCRFNLQNLLSARSEIRSCILVPVNGGGDHENGDVERHKRDDDAKLNARRPGREGQGGTVRHVLWQAA